MASLNVRATEVLPRLIRLRDAPSYLGMDRNRFNQTVRPCLIEIPIDEQGVAFDRLDLDAWAEDYKSRNGRPGRMRGEMKCETPPDFDLTENNGSGNAATLHRNAAKKRGKKLDHNAGTDGFTTHPDLGCQGLAYRGQPAFSKRRATTDYAELGGRVSSLPAELGGTGNIL